MAMIHGATYLLMFLIMDEEYQILLHQFNIRIYRDICSFIVKSLDNSELTSAIICPRKSYMQIANIMLVLVLIHSFSRNILVNFVRVLFTFDRL